MKKIVVCCLLVLVSCLSVAQQSKIEKLKQLKSREDIKVTEVEPEVLKLEYPDGKILYKNIGEYKPPTDTHLQKTKYSPNYDSTIIDVDQIDTMLYYQKYSYWQTVPLGNFRTLLVGDINKNGRPELYGQMKDYWTDYTNIMAFEMNTKGKFESAYTYDGTVIAKNIYDIDKDGKQELHLARNYVDETSSYLVWSFLFYKQSNDSSIAKDLSFTFKTRDTSDQQNDNYFGDWDGDELTDQIFIEPSSGKDNLKIYEYNPLLNNFDMVYHFDYRPLDLYYKGFSIGDFDQDGQTEFIAGSIHGKVLSIENTGNNSYSPNREGKVETYNAYLCTETNDLDGNGKKEIWIGGDAFYSGVGVTRITLFEADGNDSYQAVGKIDLVGVMSFDAGNIQTVDIDKDGKEEVLIGIDQHAIILKFNGSKNHQIYEVFYIKKNDFENNSFVYEGASLYDLDGDFKEELIINMYHITPNVGLKLFTQIFRPNFPVDVVDDQLLVEGFKLSQNYPNPFNGSTNITVTLPSNTTGVLYVYDTIGRLIKKYHLDKKGQTKYEINWNGLNDNNQHLSSGFYLGVLKSDDPKTPNTKTIKMIYLK